MIVIFLQGIHYPMIFFIYHESSRKKGGVGYYKNPDRETKPYIPPRNKPIFFTGAIMKFFLKIILDLNIVYYETNNVPRLGVNDAFLKKNNIREYAPQISSENLILDVIKKSKITYKEYDNLIIDDGPLTNIVTLDSIRKVYAHLFQMPMKFVFKKHPNPTQEILSDAAYYDIFKDCETAPDYIPVELLYNNVKKNVITVYSTGVISAAYFPHIKVISLLELVEWYHESFKMEVKQLLLEKSKNKILFPKSYTELDELLH